jgi:hypothetical protein
LCLGSVPARRGRRHGPVPTDPGTPPGVPTSRTPAPSSCRSAPRRSW